MITYASGVNMQALDVKVYWKMTRLAATWDAMYWSIYASLRVGGCRQQKVAYCGIWCHEN